jgi:hypothetical protein
MKKVGFLVTAAFLCIPVVMADGPIDLTSAVIVVAADAPVPEQKAADMLADEIEKRTFVRLAIANSAPAKTVAAIAIGTKDSLGKAVPALAENIETPGAAEGYTVRAILGYRATVLVVGADARGTLFGVGRLLRELRMTRGSITLPRIDITSSPKVALRGHQVGYRPKVNTYDGWTVDMYEQYIRDMIVFGTNAIELIPPRSDDAPGSLHFTLSPIDMLARVSQLAIDYDIQFWIWYPAMDKDYGDQATVDKAIAEWAAVFEKVPRIDAVLVPGGDPGHTEPKYLMPLLEKQTENLHRTHPNARMWMSPQGFTKEWMDEWLAIMQKDQPKWLTGVAFAPQNRLSLPDMRAAVPKQYPIRHYPDITHTYSCQYPVQDWDVALKLTHDRETINPRPIAYSEIVRWSLPYTDAGFITYSEGVNDDANKMLWSALGWDPDADVNTVIREYARYFIGPAYEDDFAKALFRLEQNWVGPLAANTGISDTLALVQKMEGSRDPHVLLNWRFQQTAYRAYFDAYVQERLRSETQLERQAMEKLGAAKRTGAVKALDDAQAILDRAKEGRVAPEFRERASNLAEALYQSIRMQTSVKRFMAIDIGRGATFDMIDKPLNNRLWLEPRFAAIRALPREADRLKAIKEIVNWTDPGPGGYYDDLGDPRNQPHLVRDVTQDFDPENRINPLLGYEDSPLDRRMSWFDDAETRFEAPLYMRYDNLDPKAEYKVRAVYAGDKWDTQMKLVADDIEVHGLIDKPNPIAPLEFDIPKEATKDGKLMLAWTQTPGRGSSGRGCQVAEVWLIKK